MNLKVNLNAQEKIQKNILLLGEFECSGENTEKYITFSVPIKKENDNGKKITYKLKFIDTCRFMSLH